MIKTVFIREIQRWVVMSKKGCLSNNVCRCFNATDNSLPCVQYSCAVYVRYSYSMQ